MIKAIIFDWGGVLAPSDHKIAGVKLRKKYDFDIGEFNSEYDLHEDETCDTSEYDGFLTRVSNKFNIPKEELIKTMNEVPPGEVFDLAKAMSENFKVHILSNQLKFRADYLRENFDLSFFDHVFFSNEIKLKKPSEKIFKYVLEKINCNADECLFIDDHMLNTKVAKKLGFNVILFKDIEQLKKELKDYKLLY